MPPHVRFFTEYLREQGYYCANRAKEDYNTRKPEGAWDESSNKASYTNREPGQPFFQVINIHISHESNIHTWSDSLRHDPAKVVLPPYHPDLPEFRHDWAQYYDKVEEMDRQVGERLNFLINSQADIFSVFIPVKLMADGIFFPDLMSNNSKLKSVRNDSGYQVIVTLCLWRRCLNLFINTSGRYNYYVRDSRRL